MLKRIVLASLVACGFAQAQGAIEVYNVKLAETANVRGMELPLKGAGVRTKWFFKVYVMGLYAPAGSDESALISASTPKHLELVLKRDVSKEKMITALQEGIAANSTKEEMAAMAQSIQSLSNLFQEGDFKETNRMVMDILPNLGVSVAVQGMGRGVIGDAQFSEALMKVWLGAKPADSDLKVKLLGGN